MIVFVCAGRDQNIPFRVSAHADKFNVVFTSTTEESLFTTEAIRAIIPSDTATATDHLNYSSRPLASELQSRYPNIEFACLEDVFQPFSTIIENTNFIVDQAKRMTHENILIVAEPEFFTEYFDEPMSCGEMKVFT